MAAFKHTRQSLKALKGSIAHWERLLTGALLHTGENLSGLDCDLCLAFRRVDNCHGCPVRAKSGRDMCRNTPYGKAYMAKNVHGMSSIQFRVAALKELYFLRSLLP